MPDRRQLDLLANLAAEKSDAHAVQLAKARTALTAAEKQHTMLVEYRDAYRTQICDRLEASVSIEVLRGHQRFLANVEQAVCQQDLEVARRRAQADAVERAWQDSERRRHGFQVMGTRLDMREQRDRDRASQKQSDELAARRLEISRIF